MSSLTTYLTHERVYVRLAPAHADLICQPASRGKRASAIDASQAACDDRQVATEEQIRALGRSVADGLARSGVAPTRMTAMEYETRSSGLFGRTKTTVAVRRSLAEPEGWSLVRQPLTQETYNGGCDTHAAEIWLGADGVLLRLDCDERYSTRTSEETKSLRSFATASADDLQIPDWSWTSHNITPEGSGLYERREWRAESPRGGSYEVIKRSLDALDASGQT